MPIKVISKYDINPPKADLTVYIGRGSPLGNPYYFGDSSHSAAKFKVSSREEAISNFKPYLIRAIKDGEPSVCDEINKIFIAHQNDETVNLKCFCPPNPCHGDCIKDFVLKLKSCINWFSNMRPFDVPMKYGDLVFLTPEHFYQAMKDKNPEYRRAISHLNSPFDAKKKGKTANLRDDWHKVKLDVMEYALKYKFHPSTYWGKKLQTYNKPIVEFNNWGDTYWGVDIYSDVGKNHLGKLLEKVKQFYE